jgi:hypothetical protein
VLKNNKRPFLKYIDPLDEQEARADYLYNNKADEKVINALSVKDMLKLGTTSGTASVLTPGFSL